jgi:OCT family organic cation transporter-like MFS transporter 4/5
MDLDNVLEEIGEFGRYQKMKYYLLCLPVFFGAANSLSYVFTAGHQHYRYASEGKCARNYEEMKRISTV